ncbi:hypothetical protein ERJ75_000236000 [Trypanosoma vivax]|uniref:Uncharacterized protein n=1 Tax=Trypanosoma vivax (strain Y486) TaxID=1055687 RepID=F9WV19_TRYVY|nr:hypothetical protein TRVL_05103 [Trypanosoma vivax]KAH8618636.1 hypothetical protein ERJ75_000236000 [Trypanosoma vivax]CCD21420.1 hypothetical protein, conserved [Trypanosoma vivax Y486]|eukprot:CCD21420.1 hypothetical protein, conserved [Trypanosoma vivax Y486]
MSKTQTQGATKKWSSQRAFSRLEDSANRKANSGVPAQQPVPQPTPSHERPSTQAHSAPVQLPQSVCFERQEAVDALSNLYRNTTNSKVIETGASVFEQRDASKVHEEIMDCLKIVSG